MAWRQAHRGSLGSYLDDLPAVRVFFGDLNEDFITDHESGNEVPKGAALSGQDDFAGYEADAVEKLGANLYHRPSD